jgi:sensor histidine kinase YesM
MATDSATLDRRAATPRRVADTPKIQSPAEPIARGMGLDRPFFDDKNRAFWILQSIGWAGYLFLRLVTGFANNRGWMWLVHTLLLTATGYSLTLLMASLFRRLIRMTPIWTLVFSFAAVAIASGAFSVIETWSVATFLKPQFRPAGVEYLGAILLDFSLLAAWTALYYGINYFLLLENEIRQREKLEGQASTAQLAMLRYQLNPHFLFNTLNAVSELMYDRPAAADEMLSRIGALLRATLSAGAQEHRLADEWKLLALYMDIQHARFGEGLDARVDGDPALDDLRIPFLLLQPLVENAIEHGGQGDRRLVRVDAAREAQRLVLRVRDGGGGVARAGHGIGLGNVGARLRHLYGDEAGVRLEPAPEGGSVVTVWLPARRWEAA